MAYTFLRECMACGCSDKLRMIADFGRTPLPNAFMDTASKALTLTEYYLELMTCDNCFHFQLGGAPAPEEMFTDYLYINSAKTLEDHHTELVRVCTYEA